MKLPALINYPILIAFFLLPMVAAGESSELLVSMKLIENGAELAAPQMLVENSSTASISFSGENAAVAISVVVTSQDQGEAHVLAEIETSRGQMSPELLVRKGRWASVSIGALEFHILVEDHVIDEQ